MLHFGHDNLGNDRHGHNQHQEPTLIEDIEQDEMLGIETDLHDANKFDAKAKTSNMTSLLKQINQSI